MDRSIRFLAFINLDLHNFHKKCLEASPTVFSRTAATDPVRESGSALYGDKGTEGPFHRNHERQLENV